VPVPTAPTFRDRVHGCLLGGAAGDALGAAVEFLSIDEIRARFGPDGIAEPAEAYGRVAAITDDTQMTVFTAEGLIRAAVRGRTKGIVHAPTVVDHAYGRWLAGLGEDGGRWDDHPPDGWLVDVPALRAWRSPGRTCLSALRAPVAGTVAAPLNHSKGCGGVMRMAPGGLLGGPRDAFALGCDLAALTHGHPSGYLTAGALALLVARLVAGDGLDTALDAVEVRLETEIARPPGGPDAETAPPGDTAPPTEAAGPPAETAAAERAETLVAVRAARALAAAGASPTPETLASLGLGWVADEALAIAVYCALVAEDFAHGVRLAVNHSGDSDSTGAMTGSILGVQHGVGVIPDGLLADLELRDEIARLADDWVAVFGPDATADLESGDLARRYPGW
jgi:ADP-ribosylglycohydrolase